MWTAAAAVDHTTALNNTPSLHIDHKDITITFNYLGEVLFPMDIEQTLFVFQISYQDII